MRTNISWSDRVTQRDGPELPVYDITFSPDGQMLVAAAGQRVLVYDANDGELIQALRGHKNLVYCVSYSTDGKRFASGGADATIIIWTSKLEGILKYTHNDPILCMAYNPVTQQLASCTQTDFGLWSPEQKSVNKHRVNSKILCCSWTNDGLFLAMGHFNGTISIKDKNGVEKVKIDRQHPVWSLSWNPSPNEPYDILAVSDWGQRLSFYQLNGRQVTKDRVLDYDPCSLRYFSNGEYLVIGGSDRAATLWTKEGIRLVPLCQNNDWNWVCAPRPRKNFVAVGSNDGTIVMYQLVFNTVHALYKNLYAYRDFMTDVILQDLSTEEKIRIKCRDYIKKVSVYRNTLAVKLQKQLVVYDIHNSKGIIALGDSPLKPKWKLAQTKDNNLECFLLVVLSEHLILCHEKKLDLVNFDGVKEREWVVESFIKYIKVTGGPPGEEGVLIGLQNGYILQIFIQNPFPIPMIKHSSGIRCLDLNTSRTKLAIIDENHQIAVYELATNKLLFSEPNATSVTWNSDFDDMLCYSGNGQVTIKTEQFTPHAQKQSGFVVGFSSSRVYCLHVYSMNFLDISHSSSLRYYLDKKDYEKAYQIACLGVTNSDWRYLANIALRDLNFEICRKACIRIRDLKFIELIEMIENAQKNLGANVNPKYYKALLDAYEGKFDDAARVFVSLGKVQEAVDMYTSVHLWDKAKEISQSQNVDMTELLENQAKMSEQDADWEQAAKIYVDIGQYSKAIELFGEMNMMEHLYEITRELNIKERDALMLAAEYFLENQLFEFAEEVYIKLKHFEPVLKMYVKQKRWEEAMKIVKKYPDNSEFADLVYLPYANHLAANGQFEETQKILFLAGKPEESLKILERLTHSAVIQNRFDDSSYYFFKLSRAYLSLIKNTYQNMNLKERSYFQKYQEFDHLAEIYYTYQFIHQFIIQPFTTLDDDTLFNISKFLFSSIPKEAPAKVSKMYILYALAKQSRKLGCNKLAKFAYDKLSDMWLPPSWIDSVDKACINIRANPFVDKEELLSVCYRCSYTNPFGPVCINCQHPFIHSMHCFDILPLVEFVLDEDIGEEEALELINKEPSLPSKPKHNSNVQTLDLEADEEENTDPFSQHLDSLELSQKGTPISVGRSLLEQIHSLDIFIIKSENKSIKTKYYKNMFPEVSVTNCPSCNRFFHQEDFDLLLIQKGMCPFCRYSDFEKSAPTNNIK